MIKINSNYFITIKILNINSIRILNTGLGFLSQQIQGIQKKKITLGNFFLIRTKLRLELEQVLFQEELSGIGSREAKWINFGDRNLFSCHYHFQAEEK